MKKDLRTFKYSGLSHRFNVLSHNFIGLCLGISGLIGNVSRGDTPQDESSGAAIDYDFCSLSRPAQRPAPQTGDGTSDATSLSLWNAATVQTQLRRLILDPNLIDTPWNSYPVAYVAMTAARDFERCNNRSLATKNRSHQIIGDLLADLMSRWLALSSQQCAASPSLGDRRSGFCAAFERIRNQATDTFGASLEITTVYLSSHMAMSLAAVVRDDLFWNQEFPADTHCLPGKACPRTTIENRIKWVKSYKTHYDRNNRFLAGNISTIVTTLRQACYLRGGVLDATSMLANNLPGLELLFGNIRDKTFQAAIELARTLPPESHPMLEKQANGLFTRQFKNVRFFESMPPSLASAETNARALLRGPLFLTSALPGLGSRSWSDLAANPPSANARCNAWAKDF